MTRWHGCGISGCRACELKDNEPSRCYSRDLRHCTRRFRQGLIYCYVIELPRETSLRYRGQTPHSPFLSRTSTGLFLLALAMSVSSAGAATPDPGRASFNDSVREVLPASAGP